MLEFDVFDLISVEPKEIKEPTIIENLPDIAPVLKDGVFSIATVNYNDLDYNIFQEIKGKQPLLIKNMTSSWPAVNLWKSQEYFSTFIGKREILVLTAKDNIHFLKKELSIHHSLPGDSTCKKIMEEDIEDSRLYARMEFRQKFLQDVSLPLKLVMKPEQLESCDSTVFQLPFKKENCTIWVGSGGNITPLHYDLCHGFLCQIAGTKKITLFHKDDFRSLYPNPTTHPNKTVSRVVEYEKLRDGDKVCIHYPIQVYFTNL